MKDNYYKQLKSIRDQIDSLLLEAKSNEGPLTRLSRNDKYMKMAKTVKQYMNGDQVNASSKKSFLDSLKSTCSGLVETTANAASKAADTLLDFASQGLSLFKNAFGQNNYVMMLETEGDTTNNNKADAIANVAEKTIENAKKGSSLNKKLIWIGSACFLVAILYLLFNNGKLSNIFSDFKSSVSKFYHQIGSHFESNDVGEIIKGVLKIFYGPLAILAETIVSIYKNSNGEHLVPIGCIIGGVVCFSYVLINVTAGA